MLRIYAEYCTFCVALNIDEYYDGAAREQIEYYADKQRLVVTMPNATDAMVIGSVWF